MARKTDKSLGITPEMKQTNPVLVETLRAAGWNPLAVSSSGETITKKEAAK